MCEVMPQWHTGLRRHDSCRAVHPALVQCWHTSFSFLRDYGILCSPASALVTHCVNCTLFQQISVPGLRWAMALTLYNTFQRKSFRTTICLLVLVLHLIYIFFVPAPARRARWTSWSRRQTWPWWSGAAAGGSSLLAPSRSAQVSRGRRGVSSAEKLRFVPANQLLLRTLCQQGSFPG